MIGVLFGVVLSKEILRLINLVARHFAAASMSLRVTRSFDATRMLTMACMASVADAVLRAVSAARRSFGRARDQMDYPPHIQGIQPGSGQSVKRSDRRREFGVGRLVIWKWNGGAGG